MAQRQPSVRPVAAAGSHSGGGPQQPPPDLDDTEDEQDSLVLGVRYCAALLALFLVASAASLWVAQCEWYCRVRCLLGRCDWGDLGIAEHKGAGGPHYCEVASDYAASRRAAQGLIATSYAEHDGKRELSSRHSFCAALFRRHGLRNDQVMQRIARLDQCATGSYWDELCPAVVAGLIRERVLRRDSGGVLHVARAPTVMDWGYPLPGAASDYFLESDWKVRRRLLWFAFFNRWTWLWTFIGAVVVVLYLTWYHRRARRQRRINTIVRNAVQELANTCRCFPRNPEVSAADLRRAVISNLSREFYKDVIEDLWWNPGELSSPVELRLQQLRHHVDIRSEGRETTFRYKRH